MARIIDGKNLAEQILSDLKAEIKNLGLKPSLGIIKANNDSSSEVYVKMKMKKAKDIGIRAELINVPQAKNFENFKETVQKIVTTREFNSYILQLPLYKSIDKFDNIAVNLVPPELDADGISANNLGKAMQFLEDAIIPATVQAILVALGNATKINLTWENIKKSNKPLLKGKIVSILNNTFLIGLPLSNILSKLGATVYIVNEFSPEYIFFRPDSDIIISATGVSQFISSFMVKEGAILVDVTSVRKGGTVIGDFILDDEMLDKIAAYTPVPGGIGPLTIACLLENVVTLEKRRLDIAS